MFFKFPLVRIHRSFSQETPSTGCLVSFLNSGILLSELVGEVGNFGWKFEVRDPT